MSWSRLFELFIIISLIVCAIKIGSEKIEVEKERKVNLTKKMLLENFAETLECLNITDYTTFTETEIDFKYTEEAAE